MSNKALVSFLLIIVGIVLGTTATYLYFNNSKDIIIESVNINKLIGENQIAYDNQKEDNKTSENEIKYKKNLIGFWHANPDVAAGYNDCFEFFQDGSFVFKYNQYDGEKRIIDISGKWEIMHVNLLALTIVNKTVIQGGEFKRDVASETTEYVLRNGTIKQVQVNPPEKVIYPLGELGIDNKYQYPVVLDIGGKRYWKLGSTGEEIIK